MCNCKNKQRKMDSKKMMIVAGSAAILGIVFSRYNLSAPSAINNILGKIPQSFISTNALFGGIIGGVGGYFMAPQISSVLNF